METCLKANGLTIKLMVKEHIFIWTEQSTLVNGLKINNTDMVLKLGQIVHVMKVIMNMERSTGPVHSSGLILLCSLGSFITIIFMEKVFICGVTVENMRVNGKIIKCTEKEVSLGAMEECTWASMLMTKRMGMVNSNGQMVEVIRGTG